MHPCTPPPHTHAPARSCKDDINNQAIVDLAREVDRDGRRTLGVLTKPDTIGAWRAAPRRASPVFARACQPVCASTTQEARPQTRARAPQRRARTRSGCLFSTASSSSSTSATLLCATQAK